MRWTLLALLAGCGASSGTMAPLLSGAPTMPVETPDSGPEATMAPVAAADAGAAVDKRQSAPDTSPTVPDVAPRLGPDAMPAPPAAEPSIAAMPTPIDFGGVKVGSNPIAMMTVNITTSGLDNGGVIFAAAYVTNAAGARFSSMEFSVWEGSGAQSCDGACQIHVVFNPLSTAKTSAVLGIAGTFDHQRKRVEISVPLSGYGTVR